MKRFKTPEADLARDRNIKGFLPDFTVPPSARKMSSFAAQFSREEWEALCKNPYFLEFMDHDLDKAKIIACKLLRKSLD